MDGVNCVVLEIPDLVGTEAAMTMANIHQQLSYFGDIDAVTMFHDPVSSLMVNFSDPNAAVAAREAFGSSWHIKEWCLAAEMNSLISSPAFSSPWDTAERFDAGIFGAEEVSPANATPIGMLPRTPSASLNNLQSLLGGGIEVSSSVSDSDKPSMGWTRKFDSEPFTALPSTTKSQPRFLSGLELFQLNWERLANGQEWRRELLLRGLPRRLCEQGLVELLLARRGLSEDVSKVCLVPTRGARVGSAVVHTTSSQATYRVAKLFHGLQFACLRSPVAVSFAAAQKTLCMRRTQEPMCVKNQQTGLGFLSTGVEPPPGLER